jgi:tetratricopeptide (TPR) repeat protein
VLFNTIVLYGNILPPPTRGFFLPEIHREVEPVGRMMPHFIAPRERDAWATIRGYVYQVDLTIARWLDVEPGDLLELERGEDIDLLSRAITAQNEEEQRRLLEQVKHREHAVTLRTPAAIAALANFFAHRTANPNVPLFFRYTTNARVGCERPSPILGRVPALVAWEQLRRGDLQEAAQRDAVDGIRDLLLQADRPSDIHQGTWSAFQSYLQGADHAQLFVFIQSFEWSTDTPSVQKLGQDLKQQLIDRGYAIDAQEAEAQYFRLFLHVVETLSSPGIKQLQKEDLERLIALPTLSATDHAKLEALREMTGQIEQRLEAVEEQLRSSVVLQVPYPGMSPEETNQRIAGIVDLMNRAQEREHLFSPAPEPQGPPSDEVFLPLPARFVGRQEAIEWLRERLVTSGKRAATALIGMAGLGKTALATKVIRQLRAEGHFHDGIAVIHGSGQTDTVALARIILARFDPYRRRLEHSDFPALIDVASSTLGTKDVLIVLDNIEPDLAVIDVVRLFTGSGATVLLTARHQLPYDAMPQEGVYTVGLLPPGEALELFAHASGRVSPDAFAPQEWDAANRIIQALESHTLAIVLAGAYAVHSGRDLEALALELLHPWRAIELPDGQTPSAVATMFDQSIRALPKEAKQVLLACAAFGTTEFSRNATLAVARELSVAHPESCVDLLVSRYLVEAFAITNLPVGSDRERLNLHQLIRGCAEAGFKHWTERRRKRVFAAIARYYASYSKSQKDEALSNDEVNIIAAIEWAHAQRHDAIVADLCAGMRTYWVDHWHVEAAQQYLPWGMEAAKMVASTTQAPSDLLRAADLVLAYSQVLLDLGQLDQAQKLLQASLTCFHDQGSRKGEAATRYELAQNARLRGNSELAKQYLEDSLVIMRELNERHGEAVVLAALGQLALLEGKFQVGKDYCQQARSVLRDDPHPGVEGWISFILMFLAALEGRMMEAAELLREGQSHWQHLKGRGGQLMMLIMLGQLAISQGHFQEAWSLYQQSLALAREMRDQRGQAASLLGLSIIHLAANQLEQAELLTQEILSLLHHVSDHGIEVVTWLISAQIAVARGRFDEAEQRYRTCLDLVRQGPGALYPVVAIECAQFLIIERHKQHEGCALLDETIQRYTTMGLDNEARDARAFAQQLGCGDAQTA